MNGLRIFKATVELNLDRPAADGFARRQGLRLLRNAGQGISFTSRSGWKNSTPGMSKNLILNYEQRSFCKLTFSGRCSWERSACYYKNSLKCPPILPKRHFWQLKLNFFQFLLRALAVRAGPVLQLAAFSAALWLILRGLRWQFGLNLFQHAHGFLTIVPPTMITSGDVLSGRLEVGRVTCCRWTLQGASGYRRLSGQTGITSPARAIP